MEQGENGLAKETCATLSEQLHICTVLRSTGVSKLLSSGAADSKIGCVMTVLQRQTHTPELDCRVNKLQGGLTGCSRQPDFTSINYV